MLFFLEKHNNAECSCSSKGKDHSFLVGNSSASLLLGIMQKLAVVDSNANVNDMIENERSCSSKLTGEILDLILQVQKMSKDVCSQGPTSKVMKITETEENMHQKSGINSVQQRLVKQLKKFTN